MSRQMGEVLRAAAAILVAAISAAAVFVVYLVVSGLLTGAAESAAAAFAPAALFGTVALGLALAHAVLLGLPLFLVLRWVGWTRWWVSLIVGFAIGSLPYAVAFSPLWGEAADFYQAGDKILVQQDMTTFVGWVAYGAFAGGLGLLGMAGGLAAWLTWYWLGRAMIRSTLAAA